MSNPELMQRIEPLVGTEVCVGNWVDITQKKIDAFAELTGDHQWIHVDPERAKHESPFGSTIAHGIFSLALLPAFFEGFMAQHGLVSGVNYGCEKTRFPAPVPVGSRVRGRYVLKSLKNLGKGGLKLVISGKIEIEGQEKPGCVTDIIVLASG